MNTLLRKTLTGAVTALSLGAMVVATASPAAAWGGRRFGGGWGYGPGIAAGVLGGLALGAIVAGSSHPAYAAPVSAEPAYAPPVAYEPDGYCHREWRPVYRADGAYLRDRQVRVCD